MPEVIGSYLMGVSLKFCLFFKVATFSDSCFILDHQSEDLELRQAALYGIGVLAQVAPDATFMPVRDGMWQLSVFLLHCSCFFLFCSSMKSIFAFVMTCDSVFATYGGWYPSG